MTPGSSRVFEDIVVDWEAYKADIRCIPCVLDSTAGIDVILSAVRFATDMIWYPEFAGALSPHTLADLFFDCLLDGRIIPGKLEHAISIRIALASVLDVRLSIEALCQHLRDHVQWKFSLAEPESPPPLAMAAFKLFVLSTPNALGVLFAPMAPGPLWSVDHWALFWGVPDQLSVTHKPWLTRVVLQTLWRCQHVQKPTAESWITEIRLLVMKLMAGDGRSVVMLKTNCFLIAAVSLGFRIDFHDLYPPDNMCVIPLICI